MRGSSVNKILHEFSIVNWFSFVVRQEIRYKHLDMGKNFFSLYSFLLMCVLNSTMSKLKKKYALECCKKMGPCSDEEVVKHVKSIRKHFFWGNRIDYRFLLTLELLHTLHLLGGSENDKQVALKLISENLKLRNIPLQNWTVESISEYIKDAKTLQSIEFFIDYCKQEKLYNSLSEKNIAVCATMSAGKSTFVNALLGQDVLPARNEATTAKITSVYDKDGTNEMVGFTKKGNVIASVSSNVDSLKINEWNGDALVDHIYLQGDLDNIGNSGFIGVVHDTPGTNNSSDESHHEITMKFLKGSDLDALIYVANAEHLCTTDEKNLLTQIYDEVVKPRKVPILFILNKADNIDQEKEKIENVMDIYSLFLKDIGFEKTTIMPASSKAARLLKMALNERGYKFTEAENDLFPIIVKKFTKRINLAKFSKGSVSVDENKKKSVMVDGESYDCNQLKIALSHSGIERIEKAIESLFNKI